MPCREQNSTVTEGSFWLGCRVKTLMIKELAPQRTRGGVSWNQEGPRQERGVCWRKDGRKPVCLEHGVKARERDRKGPQVS